MADAPAVPDLPRPSQLWKTLDPEKKRATLKTTCTVGGKVVIDGEATVLPRSRA